MGNNKKMENKTEETVIDCMSCKTQADCCRLGAWIDLEEAKKIATLGLKGEFFQLERDADFPSGFRIGTSYDDNPCTFLDPDGLCSVHKKDYSYKPVTCIEFPYEDNELSSYVSVLCTPFKSRKETKKKPCK